ncbi:hypothetical protein RM764_42280 [Streptomyces sp. DSM 41699]|uniref:Uncharacterized protein n=1 Tax=Streptomyces gibsoniae TaxID=3075529 RepID=A0ABU2U8E4_9ACTN|nr:hypothetical protein [Streptomyces sp. DSM 41699]MDT0469504.1 hypothetical protein [Streptomyces sp. DSM 41699]
MRTAPTAGIQQQEQLDQVLVHPWPRRLDHVHVRAPHLADDGTQLTVRKPLQAAGDGLHIERGRDGTGECLVR